MLEVKNLFAYRGAIQVLKGITLRIGEGEIVTIVGPNGAGKTTLLRTLSALHRASSGSIRFAGREIGKLEAYEIVQSGITQVLQGRQIFEHMTVLQNLRIGAYRRRIKRSGDLAPDLDEVYSYFPILHERSQQEAGTLSGGEQVMLAIGRALMSKPRMLLLDEPSFGLAPKMVDVVFEALQKLNRANLTILLVEQNAELAFGLSHRGYLMVLGRFALEGSARDLRTSDEIVDLYLGQSGRPS
jgi:branched-chain amino acid transport system ATP-binding protein